MVWNDVDTGNQERINIVGMIRDSVFRKKRFLVTAMSVGRVPLWKLLLCLIWIPGAPAYFWAVLLLAIQVLFWFADASGNPAWMDMVGKSVRHDRRGRFFATRQVVGGPPFINCMLAIVPEHERPRYARLMGIGYVPAALAPIIGGLIMQFWNDGALFAITAVLSALALLVALRLPAAESVR